MSSLRVFKAERIIEVLKRAMTSMCMTAHADTEDGESSSDTTPTPQPQINYEQLIAQARKEEKDKLYPKIKKLEEEKANLVKIGNDNLIKIGDLTQTIQNLNAEIKTLKEGNGEETQEVKDLKSQIATLTAENEKLKNETPNEEELRKKIEQEYEVKLYLNEQTTANKDSILSSFMSEVQGSTKEEIDASITAAKEKSLAIKKELGLVDDEGKPIHKTSRQQSKSKSDTQQRQNNPAPAANPADTNPGQTYDADYIRNLDPRSEEYKEFRKSLGLK